MEITDQESSSDKLVTVYLPDNQVRYSVVHYSLKKSTKVESREKPVNPDLSGRMIVNGVCC